MIRDKLGREIKAGCFIVYGHDRSELRVGKVLEASLVWERRGQVRFHVPRIRVRGVDDDFQPVPELCQKDGTLEHPRRVIILNAEDIPGHYRYLLDPLQTA